MTYIFSLSRYKHCLSLEGASLVSVLSVCSESCVFRFYVQEAAGTTNTYHCIGGGLSFCYFVTLLAYWFVPQRVNNDIVGNRILHRKKNSHDLAVRCRCCAQILQMSVLAGWLMCEACTRDERTPKKRANESKRGKSFAFDR